MPNCFQIINIFFAIILIFFFAFLTCILFRIIIVVHCASLLFVVGCYCHFLLLLLLWNIYYSQEHSLLPWMVDWFPRIFHAKPNKKDATKQPTNRQTSSISNDGRRRSFGRMRRIVVLPQCCCGKHAKIQPKLYDNNNMQHWVQRAVKARHIKQPASDTDHQRMCLCVCNNGSALTF